jgi:hypothetical protein
VTLGGDIYNDSGTRGHFCCGGLSRFQVSPFRPASKPVLGTTLGPARWVPMPLATAIGTLPRPSSSSFGRVALRSHILAIHCYGGSHIARAQRCPMGRSARV